MALPYVLHFKKHISVFSHLCSMLSTISPPTPLRSGTLSVPLSGRMRAQGLPDPPPSGIPQAPWLDDRLLEPTSPRAASETRSPVPNNLSDRVSIALLVSSYELFADRVTKLNWPANSILTLQLPEPPRAREARLACDIDPPH